MDNNMKKNIWFTDYQTFYSFEGCYLDVNIAVDEVKRNWPPGGYSTWARPAEELPNGDIRVVVSHFNSCD